MIKTYAKVIKNNNSIRLSIDKRIIDLLDMKDTKTDELWEIEIGNKITKEDIIKEMNGVKDE